MSLDNELITKQDAINALNESYDVKGHAYAQVHDNLISLSPRAVIHDCRYCFGASFNDCDNCNKIQLTDQPKHFGLKEGDK